jgi:hypothetical protein
MFTESRDMVHVFYLLGKAKPSEASQSPPRSLSPEVSEKSQVKLIPEGPETPKDLPFCRCRKSQCLQLKCSCFRKQAVCNANCFCVGCCNKEETKELRDAATELTREIFNNAFKTPEVIPLEHSKVNTVGCNCKRSSCQNNYCACFRAGVDCSSLCSCRQCARSKITLDFKKAPEALKRKKNKRRRLKVVCDNNQVELRRYSKFQMLRIREEKSPATHTKIT